MRTAYVNEVRAMMTLVCLRDGLDTEDEFNGLASSRAFILDDYITDCPGYAGPVGLVIWGGSPTWVTIFTKHKGEWEIAHDTVQTQEGDQRGEFEEVDEFLGRVHGDDYGSLCEVLDNHPSEVTELFETGSVEIQLPQGKYVLTLNVKKVQS